MRLRRALSAVRSPQRPPAPTTLVDGWTPGEAAMRPPGSRGPVVAPAKPADLSRPHGKPARLLIVHGASPEPRRALADLLAALEHDGYLAGERTHQAVAAARAALHTTTGTRP